MAQQRRVRQQVLRQGPYGYVEGRLQIRDWTDKDGNKRRNAEVVADNVYFGDSKKEYGGDYGGRSCWRLQGGRQGRGRGAGRGRVCRDRDEEDLPF